MPLLPLCSQIDVGATVNALLGDTFSRENNTHGSRFHDRDPQFASRILGAMTQSCYIGTRDIRSRVIRGPYCIGFIMMHEINEVHRAPFTNIKFQSLTDKFPSNLSILPDLFGMFVNIHDSFAHAAHLKCICTERR